MGKKILAIDDDAAFIQLLEEACVGAGYEFKSASNGKEGLAEAKTFRPDVVLLDLMMPLVHGYEVCAKIRADKDLCRAKVIVLSAKGYPMDKNAALEAGADHYLVKPFRLPALFALLP
ncbi:MAG: response regulator [Elusimicrobia bacterium]|nr:response regulator [Elusimicrobiota bacterium]